MIPEEENLHWMYNVPVSVEFEIEKIDTCPICQADALCKWLSKYLTANIPVDSLQNVIRKKFGVFIDESVLKEHKRHIRVFYLNDDELRAKVIDDLRIIESDLPTEMDEDKALESGIKLLWAKILFMRKKGDMGKEYLMALEGWRKFIELKKKVKKEIDEDDGIGIDVTDMVQIGEKKKDDTARAIEIRNKQ